MILLVVTVTMAFSLLCALPPSSLALAELLYGVDGDGGGEGEVDVVVGVMSLSGVKCPTGLILDLGVLVCHGDTPTRSVAEAASPIYVGATCSGSSFCVGAGFCSTRQKRRGREFLSCASSTVALMGWLM